MKRHGNTKEIVFKNTQRRSRRETLTRRRRRWRLYQVEYYCNTEHSEPAPQSSLNTQVGLILRGRLGRTYKEDPERSRVGVNKFEEEEEEAVQLNKEVLVQKKKCLLQIIVIITTMDGSSQVPIQFTFIHHHHQQFTTILPHRPTITVHFNIIQLRVISSPQTVIFWLSPATSTRG